jgi:UPF0271 protein
MKSVILDTTALIFLADFSAFEDVYTVQDVIDEVKDRMTSMKLSALLKELKVVEPEQGLVDEIKSLAEETGDLSRLSETDIKVLALAKQTGGTIISDDYGVQNVAGHAGIEFVSVFNPTIKKLKKWRTETE